MKTHEKAYRPWKRVHQWSRVCCGPAGHFLDFSISLDFLVNFGHRGITQFHAPDRGADLLPISYSNRPVSARCHTAISFWLFCICFIFVSHCFFLRISRDIWGFGAAAGTWAKDWRAWQDMVAMPTDQYAALLWARSLTMFDLQDQTVI